MTDDDIRAACAALARPFDPAEVKFRPGATAGNRALAIGYVDARVVMDRLDEVVGPLNWQDEYDFLPDTSGTVLCRLKVRIGGEWITKCDVGGPSEQPDEGDRRKAAVSDALKRAAVKLGIGRYLYRLPPAWVDYDPQKKQLKGRPPLPGQARQQVNGKALQPAAQPVASLKDRILRLDAWLVKQGLGEPEGLLAKLVAKADVPLDDLPQERADAAVKYAHQLVRETMTAACSDRMSVCGIATLGEAIELAKLPPDVTYGTMSYEQMARLLATLREQPADVTV